MTKKSRKKSKQKKQTTKKAFSTPLFANKATKPQSQDITQLNETLANIGQQFRQCSQAGDFLAAAQWAEKAHQLLPNQASPLTDMAVCYVKASQFEKGIHYAQQALTKDQNSITALDALSHAYGLLDKPQKAKIYGLKALQLRDAKYGQTNASINLPALPPKPCSTTKDKNIISFSLYGGLPKYCEAAIKNAAVAKDIYPDWTCHFYLDNSVPESVAKRLQHYDARVIYVDASEQKLVGTMWRFLALDGDYHRVLFRDADAVISQTEAQAVAEWVNGEHHFHMMRDAGSHTELILAGMWGAVCGVIHNIKQQMLDYLADFTENRHFADQFFLRQHIWPVIKTSLRQHDALFGFLDATDFPSSERDKLPSNKKITVGEAVTSGSFEAKVNKQDGEQVRWQFIDTQHNQMITEYCNVANNGIIKVDAPYFILEALKRNEMAVRVMD